MGRSKIYWEENQRHGRKRGKEIENGQGKREMGKGEEKKGKGKGRKEKGIREERK